MQQGPHLPLFRQRLHRKIIICARNYMPGVQLKQKLSNASLAFVHTEGNLRGILPPHKSTQLLENRQTFPIIFRGKKKKGISFTKWGILLGQNNEPSNGKMIIARGKTTAVLQGISGEVLPYQHHHKANHSHIRKDGINTVRASWTVTQRNRRGTKIYFF